MVTTNSPHVRLTSPYDCALEETLDVFTIDQQLNAGLHRVRSCDEELVVTGYRPFR